MSAKVSLSLRIDEEDMNLLSELFTSSGTTTSDGIRQLLKNYVSTIKQTHMDGFAVEFEFVKNMNDAYRPEFLGDLYVRVVLPDTVRADDFDRLVFVLPEFVDEATKCEPFRIDSFHFCRVTDDKHYQQSRVTKRNCVSFRCVDRHYGCGVFSYDGTPSDKVLEAVKPRLASCIKGTVISYLTGVIGPERVMDASLVESLNRIILNESIRGLKSAFDAD